MIKLILKGLLLWITVVSITLFLVGGAESTMDYDILIPFVWIITNVLLVILCYYTITIRELYTITGINVLNKIVGKL